MHVVRALCAPTEDWWVASATYKGEWTNLVIEVRPSSNWQRQRPLRYRISHNGQRLALGKDLHDMARVFPAVMEEVASWLSV